MDIDKEMSIDDLLIQINKIKDLGDLVFIKFDGEREENHITVIISYPIAKQKEQIRIDGDDLKEILQSD